MANQPRWPARQSSTAVARAVISSRFFVTSVDTSEAEKVPGVTAVRVIASAGTELMWAGQEVASVAANTEEAAKDATRKVKVQYEVLPHVALVELAMAQNAPVVFKDGNTRAGMTQENGPPTKITLPIKGTTN